MSGGISAEDLRGGIDFIAAREPAFARALEQVGYPEPRVNDPGYVTLLRTIVGQQVSVHAARAVWTKLDGLLGGAAGSLNAPALPLWPDHAGQAHQATPAKLRV